MANRSDVKIGRVWCAEVLVDQNDPDGDRADMLVVVLGWSSAARVDVRVLWAPERSIAGTNVEIGGELQLPVGRLMWCLDGVLSAESPEVADALAACRPFANMADQFDRQPLSKIGDDFYGIHAGTPYEASISWTDCRRARDAGRALAAVAGRTL